MTQTDGSVKCRIDRCCVFLLLVVFALFAAMMPGRARAVPAVLATSSGAPMPVVVKPGASTAVYNEAVDLAGKLSQIVGQTVPVITGDGSTGIAVGVGNDFTTWPFDGTHFTPSDATMTEDYDLRSHSNGVWVAGATEMAVGWAVWDLLHHIGYRYYVPDSDWEIIPFQPELTVDIDKHEHPDYYDRTLSIGYNTWSELRGSYATWQKRNRLGAGLKIATSHAYEGIISRNSAEFTAHPEYRALVGGVRQGTKFCISNADLRQLVVDDALTRFAANPALRSVSMEPSDGGGWCECSFCLAMGSVTDRVVTLANQVATAVNAVYPNQKYIGMYAYNEHSPPPTISVNPRVVVNVATAFIREGYTVDELVTGWQGKGATLGIREYHSVRPWDKDLPGKSRASNLTYLKNTIPKFYNQGARFMISESGDNWGPHLIGYYVTARGWWNVDEASNPGALQTEIVNKCFSDVTGPMNSFFNLIDGSNAPLLSTDLVGRMYGYLNSALGATAHNDVRRRIRDLILYTRYVELYRLYSTSTGTARQNYFAEMLNFTYRIREHRMVHSYGLWRDDDGRDNGVTMPEDCGYGSTEDDPCKEGVPYTDTEIGNFLSNGITNNPTLPWTPKSFSDDLVPNTPLGLTSFTGGSFPYFRGVHTLHTWVNSPPSTIGLDISAGWSYSDRGPARVELYARENATLGLVDYVESPPDKVTRSYSLDTTFPGMHTMELSDGSGTTRLAGNSGHPLTWEPYANMVTSGRYYMFFYVPKGTTIIGGYAAGAPTSPSPTIRDATGTVRHTITAPGYFGVTVPSGQDGKVWKLNAFSGGVELMTVPNLLAPSTADLLLPIEVVMADETTAPSVAITTPSNTGTYLTGASSLNLAGTASDNTSLDEVTWSNDRGGSGTATGTDNWTIDNVPIAAGVNVITVTAYDYAGNHSSATLIVTRWTPVTYSSDLVPNTPLGLGTVTAGSFAYFRGVHTFHSWVATAPSTIDLSVSAGWSYSDRGDATVTLYAKKNLAGTPVDSAGTAPDKVTRTLSLDTTYDEMHTLVLSDGLGTTLMSKASAHPLTWQPSSTMVATGRYYLYFYVPKGTTVVGGYAGGAPTSPSPTVRDSTGTVRHTVLAAGQFSIPVPAGQDGKIWKLNAFSGPVELMTVPNLIAPSVADLLLPSEVVAADQ